MNFGSDGQWWKVKGRRVAQRSSFFNQLSNISHSKILLKVLVHSFKGACGFSDKSSIARFILRFRSHETVKCQYLVLLLNYSSNG